MLPHHLIFACVLAISHGERSPKCPAYAYEIAEAADKYTDKYNLEDEDLRIAGCYHESHFNKHKIGTHKEKGICQIKPNGAIQGKDLKLTRHQLEDIDTNVRIAFGYMATFKKCHPNSYQMSAYNTGHKCKSTAYSRAVVSDLKLGKYLLSKLGYNYNKVADKDHAKSNQDNMGLLDTSVHISTLDNLSTTNYQCRQEYDTSCKNVQLNLNQINQIHERKEYVLKEPVVIEGVVPSP